MKFSYNELLDMNKTMKMNTEAVKQLRKILKGNTEAVEVIKKSLQKINMRLRWLRNVVTNRFTAGIL